LVSLFRSSTSEGGGGDRAEEGELVAVAVAVAVVVFAVAFESRSSGTGGSLGLGEEEEEEEEVEREEEVDKGIAIEVGEKSFPFGPLNGHERAAKSGGACFLLLVATSRKVGSDRIASCAASRGCGEGDAVENSFDDDDDDDDDASSSKSTFP
jgi:hypothetical protein